MFKLDSEAAALTTFRPKDRKLVEFSPDLKWPLIVRHCASWVHPAGGRVYVVFAVPGGAPTGLAFDSDGGGGAGVPHMCDWCHRSGSGTEVGLLTTRLNSHKRVGVHVCSTLNCKDHLEDEANRAGRSVLPELEKLVARMGRFASEALGIDLSGAGR